MKPRAICLLLAGLWALDVGGLKAAEQATIAAPVGADLFPDPVVCQGTGVEIRKSQLTAAFTQFKANAAARGQRLDNSRRAQLEAALLDRLVITRLLLHQGTNEDQQEAEAQATELIEKTRASSGSDKAMKRQLAALGFTEQDFRAQLLERATCEAVINRVLQSKTSITDEQVKRYYEEHTEELRRPEMLQLRQLFLSTRDPVSGSPLTESEQGFKRELAEKLLERARKGEDFAALAKEFSEDPGSRDRGGQYLFSRGQMPQEYESIAFALQPGELSELVTTRTGFLILKLEQRIPEEQLAFDKIQEEIRAKLQRGQIQEELLPGYVSELKQQAKLIYLNGARPPDAFPSAKP